MNTLAISIARIDVGVSRRALSRPAVKTLAASITEVGLINPITVFRVGDAFNLIAGRHRVEAAKSLGWTEIEAVLLDLNDIDREIAEIDENLVRHDLKAAEEAQQTARRKELYLKKHPETANPNVRGGPGRGKKTTDKKSTVSFAADTASKTGIDERTVRRSAHIGEAIAPDVFEAIADTPIADSKKDLTALADLSQEAQREIVAEVDLSDKAAVREAIAARKPDPKPAPEPEPATTEVIVTVEAFARAALSLFTHDECGRLISMIREGLR